MVLTRIDPGFTEAKILIFQFVRPKFAGKWWATDSPTGYKKAGARHIANLLNVLNRLTFPCSDNLDPCYAV